MNVQDVSATGTAGQGRTANLYGGCAAKKLRGRGREKKLVEPVRVSFDPVVNPRIEYRGGRSRGLPESKKRILRRRKKEERRRRRRGEESIDRH